jgi:hypothetical protein
VSVQCRQLNRRKEWKEVIKREGNNQEMYRAIDKGRRADIKRRKN